MRIESSSDLIFLTYYMMEWGKVKQSKSNNKCVQCGSEMNYIEDVIDRKGNVYGGLVCHKCKRVIWFKKGNP